MNFDILSPITGFIGALALLIIGLSLVKVLHQLRRLDRHVPGAAPSKTFSALVIIACVIAMICAALRAWQFSLLGH